MIIGVPKEIKNHEYRVGLVPCSVKELTKAGHQVLVEKDAGLGIDFTNEAYIKAGATIVDTPKQIYKTSKMIVKVKEPLMEECSLIQSDQIIFTFLHLASDPNLAERLLATGCVGIAYETVTDKFNQLPLLSPMSQVAGRMAVQVGAHYLEKHNGGRGILIGGLPGVKPANITIIGAGVAGSNALKIAVGMGARVEVLDISIERLEALEKQYPNQIETIFSSADNLYNSVKRAHLVIGAVLIPGGSSPKLVTREMIKEMKPHSVMVDISIDQGGCFETSRPTSHNQPIYTVDNILHYCVTNIPGAVPRTSCIALNNVTLPFVKTLAKNGYKKAFQYDHHLLNGLNIFKGKITHKLLAQSLSSGYTEPNIAC